MSVSISQAGAAPALQLPYDVMPTPTTGVELAEQPLLLVWPMFESAIDPLVVLATALAIMVARYGSQPQVPLGLSWMRADGHLAWTTGVTVRTEPGASARGLLTHLRQLILDGASHADGDAWSTATARVAWCESAPTTIDGSAALTLQAWPVGTGVAGRFVFNARVLRPATIARFVGHLGEVVGFLRSRGAAAVDASLLHVPLLTPSERAWLDDVAEGPSRTLPDPRVHQLIEAHAQARPDAVAVRYRDEHLTYRQLNDRSNQLARALIARGVAAETRVAVCLEPSLDIAIALVGILKAGGVYVPVEPTYPTSRITAILDEAAPPVVLCRTLLAERLGITAWPRLDLSTLPSPDAAERANLALALTPTQSASIYYTSGTTGRPKGVVATQANLTTYILTAQRRYAIDARDVMPAIARFSFSISMFELMSPLVAGGTLIVLDREHVLDLARMAATLRTVTFLHAGPSLLRHLLPYLEQHQDRANAFANIRHASSGGDLIAPEVLEALKRVFPGADVFVIYGCSEISCMGCTYPVPRDRMVARTFVGKPFEDVAVRVLDGAGQPVPVGVVGEIHFAGGGLVRGYLDRPDLTDDKFIVRGGRRWYRTGDMGRLSVDGWIEILGRNDFQVKLRGMRLELGEVEYHLRRAPGVRDAVAMGKAGPDGEPMLVGYVVMADEALDQDPAATRSRAGVLRRHMVDHVPDYMVPTAYLELPRLPLNHNMKVDRFALPDPPSIQARSGEPTTASSTSDMPTTEPEQALAAIWMRLLDLPAVALTDNFFDIGGDSLRALAFVSAVATSMGVTLLGMDVLRESLVVLAAQCDRDRGIARTRSMPTLVAAAQAIQRNFHFGPGNSLYGVLTQPGTDAPLARHAVLICSPAGQEQVRAYFVLGRLAKHLAMLGIASLRFDYHGVGDSLGDGPVGSIDRWRHDVIDAGAVLRARTGARRVTVVGVRLGAVLAVAARRELDPAHLVLWDPVTSGVSYHADLTMMQRAHARATSPLRRGRPASVRAGVEDLVGTAFTAGGVRELRRLEFAPLAATDPLPIDWLVTTAPRDSSARFAALTGNQAPTLRRQHALDLESGWTDINRMEDVVSDAGISRALVAMIVRAATDDNRDDG